MKITSTSLFTLILPAVITLSVPTRASEADIGGQWTRFVIELSNAGSASDFKQLVDRAEDCTDQVKAVCEWEVSIAMFSWLRTTKSNLPNGYDATRMFRAIENSIESGVAEKLGTPLNEMYAFGLFGIPVDDELAKCWSRISLTTSDKVSISHCKEIELKRFGRQIPWMQHGSSN